MDINCRYYIHLSFAISCMHYNGYSVHIPYLLHMFTSSSRFHSYNEIVNIVATIITIWGKQRFLPQFFFPFTTTKKDSRPPFFSRNYKCGGELNRRLFLFFSRREEQRKWLRIAFCTRVSDRTGLMFWFCSSLLLLFFFFFFLWILSIKLRIGKKEKIPLRFSKSLRNNFSRLLFW